MRRQQLQAALVLGGVLLVGLALRLINLGTEPYWGDEVLSLDIVRQFPSIPELVNYLRWVEVHPPLYYVLLHYWAGLFGYGEAAVRALSVLFGVGTIALTYLAAQRIFTDGRIGLWAAGLVAVLPFQVEFSQEARPYIMLAFFGLLSLWAYWSWRESGRYRYLAVYAVASLAGVYLHYSYILWLVAFAALWLVDGLAHAVRAARGRVLTVWLAAHAAVAVGFWWWLDELLYKWWFLGQYTIFGIPRSVGTTSRALDILGSISNQFIWTNFHEPVAPVVGWVVTFVGLTAVVLAVFVVVQRRAEHRTYREAASVLFLAGLWVLPLVLFTVSPQSLPYAPVYERHVIASSLPLVLLVAYFLASAPVRLRAALTLLGLASVLPFLVNVVGDDSRWSAYHQLGPVASYINEQYRPGDVVFIDSVIYRSDLNHFLRPELAAVPLDPPNFYSQDLLSSRGTLGLVENEMHLRLRQNSVRDIFEKLDREAARVQPRRVWLVNYLRGYDYGVVQAWFLNRGWRHEFKSIGTLFPLDMYVAPAT